jgi:hypothetical protein
MLAQRLTTILPAMTLAEALETTRIHSAAGLSGDRTALVTSRPRRAPLIRSRMWGWSAGGMCRCRARYRWRTTACASWMNCRSPAAMSWRSHGSPSRRGSHKSNLPRLIDLHFLTDLAERLMIARDSGGVRWRVTSTRVETFLTLLVKLAAHPGSGEGNIWRRCYRHRGGVSAPLHPSDACRTTAVSCRASISHLG